MPTTTTTRPSNPWPEGTCPRSALEAPSSRAKPTPDDGAGPLPEDGANADGYLPFITPMNGMLRSFSL